MNQTDSDVIAARATVLCHGAFAPGYDPRLAVLPARMLVFWPPRHSDVWGHDGWQTVDRICRRQPFASKHHWGAPPRCGCASQAHSSSPAWLSTWTAIALTSAAVVARPAASLGLWSSLVHNQRASAGILA